MADYDKLLQVPRGTKARLEQIKLDLLANTIVYATDTKELGIKLSNGNIEYFKNATDIDAIVDTLETSKQDKLIAGENITINPDTNIISASDYTETDPIFTAWNKSTGISITKSQVSDLIEATQALSGLMSATDKTRLDVLHALLEEDTENNVVDSINEVLAIFNNYPEGADLVTALAGKVDKVTGKGLSTEDYTSAEKTKLTGIQAGAQVNTVTSVAGKTGAVTLVADDIPNLNASKINAGTFDAARIPNLAPTKITQNSSNRFVTDVEKAYWDGKQDKLVRVRIFNEQEELVAIQMIHEGESLKEENKLKNGYLFDFGTRNEFDYNTIITEDIDLTYSIIPPRYIRTTTADFNESGDYIGTEEYIILPEDKPDGYKIVNINVKGVATNGDYLTDTSNMFNGNPSLYLELDYLDTSNVTTMNRMFQGSEATALDLSSFDTSNVTNMVYMFLNSQATALDLSNFDTSNVIDMSDMFQRSRATTLDLSNFDTSNVTNMFQMFSLSKATTIDLSSFDTSNVTNMNSMFSLSQTTTIDLSSFDTSNVADMSDMFYFSLATTGYARTQTDADNFNSLDGNPSTLTFVVKVEGVIKELDTRVKTNTDRIDNLETSKQDKLVAGDNITIDEITNVISASGDIGGTVDWQDILNKPELYNKAEIDLMLGDIESALDAILGV